MGLSPQRVDEEVGGIVGDAAGFLHILTDDVNVANLAARLVVLSIKVNLRLRVALHNFTNALRHGHLRILLSPQHIGHDRYVRQRLSGTKRQVQHRAQVLLEL